MEKRCPIYKYQCIDGKCVSHSIKCGSSPVKCRSFRGSYYCGKDNGDNCVTSDPICMRPCGFSNLRHYNYTKPCPDYPGKCAYSSQYCAKKPKPCGFDETRCSNGECVAHSNYCEICSGYRCQDSGRCYGLFEKCNNVRYCADGSDELGCPKTNVPRTDSGYDSIEMLVGSLGAAVLITLMILRGWWKLNKSRRRHQEEAAILASNRRLSQQYEPRGPVRIGPGLEFEMPRIPVPPATDNPGFVPVTRPITGYSFQEPAGPLPAPPPSYSEVVADQDRYKRADPELPTYEESTQILPTRPP